MHTIHLEVGECGVTIQIIEGYQFLLLKFNNSYIVTELYMQLPGIDTLNIIITVTVCYY